MTLQFTKVNLIESPSGIVYLWEFEGGVEQFIPGIVGEGIRRSNLEMNGNICWNEKINPN